MQNQILKPSSGAWITPKEHVCWKLENFKIHHRKYFNQQFFKSSQTCNKNQITTHADSNQAIFSLFLH